MGEAKRRKLAGKQPRPQFGDPEDYVHVPGTVTVHVMHGSAPGVTAAVPLGEIDTVLAVGEEAFSERGQPFAARCIDDVLKNEKRSTTEVAITAGLWIACHASGGTVRDSLHEDATLAVLITEHCLHGRRMFDARYVRAPADADFDEIIAAFNSIAPSTEEITRHLAPH
jgi:hypothetical protein